MSLILPRLLQHRVEALAKDLVSPAGARAVDFSAPEGEPALVPADSVAWRVFANPVTLFIGGVTAVLLELAEPRVRHGVWDQSSFRGEPLGRLHRTGLAALVTVYAPESTARSMIAGVNQMHSRVSGVTDKGVPYRADDPELLDWVQVTASYGFLEAYAVFARSLGPAERDGYYAEVARGAALYGATGAPRSAQEAEAMIARMRPALEPSATIGEFMAIMRRVEALPTPGRPLQTRLLKAAVSLLPEGLAETLGLAREWRLAAWERRLVEAAAGAAERMLIRTWPSVAASRRLGLPEDWLRR